MPQERRKLRGWSYSAWASLQDCPFRFEQAQLLGNRGPPSPAMDRGIDIHKKQEYYLRGEIREIPRPLEKLATEYEVLKSKSPLTEQFWGVDNKFEPQFANVRRGERSWCVMKMDAAVLPTRRDRTLFIQDLKTGKEYPNHEDQAEIYACIGSSHYECDEVDVEFWYADAGYVTSITYKPKHLVDLTEKWIERGIDVMTPRKRYMQTPSTKACGYCHLRSDKGGPCKAWKEVM
jgi:hypothetical protein